MNVQVVLLRTYADMLMHTDTQADYKSLWCKKQNELTKDHVHKLRLIWLKYLCYVVITY